MYIGICMCVYTYTSTLNIPFCAIMENCVLTSFAVLTVNVSNV